MTRVCTGRSRYGQLVREIAIREAALHTVGVEWSSVAEHMEAMMMGFDGARGGVSTGLSVLRRKRTTCLGASAYVELRF